MTGPAVSVVVPTFNAGTHVLPTLHAVFAQERVACQVIVVDDGSTDGTPERIAASGLPVRLLAGPRTGVAAARNAGLAHADGVFVSFLDQDDLWHPQHLQRHLNAFDRRPETGVVVSPYQHWFPDPAGEADTERHPQTRMPADPGGDCDPAFSGWVYHRFLLDCWALTSATTIRREVLQQYGAFDPTLPYSEDWALWLRLSREVPFLKLPWPPVLYRQHTTQGSRQVRQVDHRCELLLRHAREHGLASRDGRAVDGRAFDRTIALYQMEFARGHLHSGDAALGVSTLWQAWRRDPARWRYLAMALAGSLGWRPHDGGQTAAAPAGGRP